MATWSKLFSFFTWKNRPDTSTPLGQTLLNRLNTALNGIDDRVITLNSQMVSSDEIQGVFTDVRLIKNTGQFVFTLLDGTEKIIDTALEKISINVRFDQATQMMVLEKEDGSIEYVDLSAFTTQFEFVSSPTIQQTVTDGKVRADIKPNSITDQMLQTNYLADITTKANTALSASQSALESQSLAEQSAEEAKSQADRAKAEADRAESVSSVDIATTEKAGIVKPDGTTITVDENGVISVSATTQVTPEMFGAIGDGVHDDTEAVKDALEHGNFVVLNNHYGITETLNITDNTYVSGVGEIVCLSFMESMVNITGSNISFRVDLNGNETAINGITISNSENVDVAECEISGFKGIASEINTNAITVNAGCKNVNIKGCRIHDIHPLEDGTGGNREGSGQAILFFKVENCCVSDCSFDSIHGIEDGDAIQIFALNETSGVVVENCIFTSIFKRAIKIQANGVTVRNNSFITTTEENETGVISCISVYGSNNSVLNNVINLHKAYRVIEVAENTSDNLISGNHIVCDKNNEYITVNNGVATFIHVAGVNTTIKNNIFDGGRQIITPYRTADNIIISDNVFINKKGYSIFTSNNCKNIKVVNNVFECSGNVCLVFSGGIENGIITDNTCTNVGYFLNVYNDNPVSCIVSSNHFIGNLYESVFRIEDTVTDRTGLLIDERQDKKSFSAPTMPTGKYIKGDICYNSNPQAGSPIGWVCVTGGASSTWKAFGMIAE